MTTKDVSINIHVKMSNMKKIISDTNKEMSKLQKQINNPVGKDGNLLHGGAKGPATRTAQKQYKELAKTLTEAKVKLADFKREEKNIGKTSNLNLGRPKAKKELTPEQLAKKAATEAQKKLNKEIKEGGKTLRELMGTKNLFNKSNRSGITDIDKFTKNLTKSGRAAKRNTRMFNMNALGIMFFGQAMKRAALQLWQYGSKAFNEIMHSVEGTYTQFDVLNGSLKYLGFVTGQALEPLAAMLVPIIDKISDWVTQNPELVQQIVKIGAILGTVFAVGGAIHLGVTSMAGAFNGLLNAAEFLVPVLEGIGTVFGGTLLTGILIVAAAIAVIILLWKTDFGNFRDFVIDTFGGMWVVVKSEFKNVLGFLSNLWKALTSLLSGDFDGFLEYMGTALANLTALFLKFVIGVGLLIVNTLSLAWNLVVDIVSNIIIELGAWIQKKFIQAIQWIVKKIMSLWSAKPGGPPAWLKSLDRGLDNSLAKVDAYKKKVKDAMDTVHTGYLGKDDMVKAMSKVDGLLGLDQKEATASSPNVPAQSVRDDGTNPFGANQSQGVSIGTVNIQANDNETVSEIVNSFQGQSTWSG